MAAALDIACVLRMESVALPLIGTGVYGNPTAMAARVHVAQVLAVFNALQTTPGTLKVGYVQVLSIQRGSCMSAACCTLLPHTLVTSVGMYPAVSRHMSTPVIATVMLLV